MLLLVLAACTNPARLDGAGPAHDPTIVPLARAGLTVEVLAQGVRVGGVADLELRTTGWGRGGDTVDAPVPTLPLGATRPRRGDPIAEWWRTVPFGVEQSWTITAPLPGRDELAIHVAIDGAEGLVAQGQGARFVDGAGKPWDVSPPTAVDAGGRSLPARLTVATEGIVVHVDDTGAAYPIVVDPVYSSPSVVLTGDIDATLGRFASSVAVGDLDGDGYADVVVGTALDGTGGAAGIHVFAGSAGGVSSSNYSGFTTTSIAVGGSVALGDVDCDGAVDVVTGARGVRAFRGRAGGSLDSTAWLSVPDDDGAALGQSVLAADVDGDGCDEVVAGAPGTADDRGAVLVFDGAATPVTTLEGPGEAGRFGHALGDIGDFDGDGADDVQIAAPGGPSGVYLGGAAGLTASAAFAFDCGECTADLGTLGDTNGDGYADFLSGDPDEDAEAGQVRVTLGAASDIGGATTLVGEGPGARLGGHWVGGDFDGDSENGAAITGGDGGVRVYPGSPDGIAFAAVQVVRPASLGSVSFIRAGDLDGDGLDELLVVEAGVGIEVFRGGADADGDGVVAEEDCNDDDATAQVEGIRYVDRDGDGFGDPGAIIASSCGGDGSVVDASDCDDTDAAVHPGAEEGQGDEVDGDCDGTEWCFADADQDGFRPYPEDDPGIASEDLDCGDPGEAFERTATGDCDDTDAERSPGRIEVIADGIDQTCDGFDLCFYDADGDGWSIDGVVTGTTSDCSGPGELLGVEATGAGDCDDADPDVHPEATEVVGDGVDGDCDGADTCYLDADGDGHRPDATSTVRGDLACAGTGQATEDAPADDCDDADAAVNPAATEVAGDGVDQDCDGADAAAVGKACGCAASPSPVTGWALFGLALGALGLRRRL